MTGKAKGIPSVRLDNEAVWASIRDRFEELVKAGRFTLGPELEQFEEAAAAFFGTRWCVGVSSGTAALQLALRSAGFLPGSRVAVPANTFYATFEAVVAAGLSVVVVDSALDHCIDLEALGALEKVRAVIPVHLYGLPADMDGLMAMAKDRLWWVLEDASQAHGAWVGNRRVGSIGNAGAFSAYPTKNLGAWGDAGFVTGSDDGLERGIRALRHHGQIEANVHELLGGTERMDNIQALVLSEKLKHLDEEGKARRMIAGWYRQALADTDLRVPDDIGDRVHVYHQFVVSVPQRDRVRAVLEEAGIGSGVHYSTPIHLQPASHGLCEVPRPPLNAERAADEVLSLPMFPGLTENDIDRVADALRTALRR